MYATTNSLAHSGCFPVPAADSSLLVGRLVMEIPSISPLTRRHNSQSASRPGGFSLLEMMIVIAVALIVASITIPIYSTAVTRTREAVLRDHLYTMRSLIEEFIRDNGRAPLRLQELVDKGYLGRLPTDPFTGSNETWRETKEDEPLSPEQTSLGIVDVHSGSDQVSVDGTAYSSW